MPSTITPPLNPSGLRRTQSGEVSHSTPSSLTAQTSPSSLTRSHSDLQPRRNSTGGAGVRPRVDLASAAERAAGALVQARPSTGAGAAQSLQHQPSEPHQTCSEAAKSAKTDTDFEKVALAVEKLPEHLRAGPVRDLAHSLVEMSKNAPIDKACAAYASTFKAAESVPVSDPNKQATLDTSRHLLAATNHLDVGFTGIHARQMDMASRLSEKEKDALHAGYMQVRGKLRPLMLKQELGKDPKAVKAILGECYRQGNNPALVVFASTLMQGLIASSDDKAQVAEGLTKLAHLAAGQHGTRTIPDSDGKGFDWAAKCANNIDVFVRKQDIDASTSTSLGQALQALRNAPKHSSYSRSVSPVPVLSSQTQQWLQNLRHLGEHIRNFIASEDGQRFLRNVDNGFAGLSPRAATEERHLAQTLGLLQVPQLVSGSVRAEDVVHGVESELAAMGKISDAIPTTMEQAIKGQPHEIPGALAEMQQRAENLRLKMTGVSPDELGTSTADVLPSKLRDWAANTRLLEQTVQLRYGENSQEAKLAGLINQDAQVANREATVQVLANVQGAQAFQQTSAAFMGRFDDQPDLQRALASQPRESSTYQP